MKWKNPDSGALTLCLIKFIIVSAVVTNLHKHKCIHVEQLNIYVDLW